MTVPAQDSAPPLDDAQQRQLLAAQQRFRKIRLIARNALWGSITSGLVGVLSVAVSGNSVSGQALSIAMVASAVVQYVAGRRLRALRPEAMSLLAWNQVVLGGLFVLYGAYRLLTMQHLQDNAVKLLASAGLPPAMRKLVVQDVHFALTLTYVLFIVFGLFFQGGLAISYFYRRRAVEQFTKETPDWIRNLLSRGYGS